MISRNNKEKDKGYVQLLRTTDTAELLKNQDAFTLLTVIAYRAKRTNGWNQYGLQIGQALIGDYKNYGMTEKRYRRAKKKLEKWQFAAFKGTNKGTVATLLDNRIYDINPEDKGRAEGRDKGGQGATNNNETIMIQQQDDVVDKIPLSIKELFASSEKNLLEFADRCGNNPDEMGRVLEWVNTQENVHNRAGFALSAVRNKIVPDSFRSAAQRRQDQTGADRKQWYSSLLLKTPFLLENRDRWHDSEWSHKQDAEALKYFEDRPEQWEGWKAEDKRLRDIIETIEKDKARTYRSLNKQSHGSGR